MGDEENFDLDDDLDLDGDEGGDDFAGSLDDALDDGLADDSAEGGDSGDSELDSFFEDLSSIEDMDADAAVAPTENAAVAAAPAVAPAPVAAPAPAKGKSKMKMMVVMAILMLGIAGGVGWFFFSEEPEQLVTEDLSLSESVMPPEVVKVEAPVLRVAPSQKLAPVVRAPVIVAPAPPSRPIAKYLVQVATCSFELCKEESSAALRQVGEPVYTEKVGEKFDLIELITSEVFSFRKANQLSKKINRTNKKAGEASIVTQSNGYRVTLGTFPALDRAKDLKFSLEKKLQDEKVRFNLEHVRKEYDSIKVYAGPYDSRKEAKNVLKELRKKPDYRGAFLVRF